MTVACALPAVAVPMVGGPGATGMVGLITSVIVPLVKLACVSVLLSVPETVNVYVPASVGVPLIVPELASDKPSGNAPLARVVEKV